MGIPNTDIDDYKSQIGEPILFEYVYRLSTPLRILAGLGLAAFILGPILFFILNDHLRNGLSDNYIFIFIFIPIFFNLIFYKKRYIFTQRGLYVIDRARGKHSSSGSPRFLAEWSDYDRFRKTFLGFKLYSHVQVQQYSQDDIKNHMPEELNRIITGTGSVTIFCGGEDETQVEYFLISRNIHPSDIG